MLSDSADEICESQLPNELTEAEDQRMLRAHKTRYLMLILLVASTLSVASLILVDLPTQAQTEESTYQYYLPVFNQFNEVLHSTSYYITTTDTAYMYELGCQLGTRDATTEGTQDSVAVLDFSYPICASDGSFGAEFFGAGPASLNQVSISVKFFASGYYNCSGEDNTSSLVIGVGTNNKPYSCTTAAKFTAHGAAWSAMVSEINQWMLSEGIFHQVQAYGASDIELGWNNPTLTRAWVDGFESEGENFYLYFGDAAGCPYEDKPWYTCGSAEWDIEDVWYFSWGAPSALPLPLIYLTSGVHAKQWAYLSQYSVAEHGYPMHFTGVFTQSGACSQFPGACSGTENTPDQAYEQLLYELNKNPETAQTLRWKTDIRWILASEINSRGFVYDNFSESTKRNALLKEISTLEVALQSQSLKPEARTLIEEKLARYQKIADKIETSRLNPASKLFD
jgi:hypothetical protein